MRPALVIVALLAPTPLYAQDRSDPNDLPPIEQKQAPPEGLFVPVSLMGGLRAGGALNVGKTAPDAQVGNPNGAIAGIDLALEFGALVFDHLYAGVIGGGTLFVSPTDTKVNVSSFVLASEFGWLTNAHGLGAYFGLGVGYRALFVNDTNGNANKFDGVEGLATIGLHVRAGSPIRIMPRVDVSVGPNNGSDGNAHALVIVGVSIWLNDDIHAKKRRHQP